LGLYQFAERTLSGKKHREVSKIPEKKKNDQNRSVKRKTKQNLMQMAKIRASDSRRLNQPKKERGGNVDTPTRIATIRIRRKGGRRAVRKSVSPNTLWTYGEGLPVETR